MDFKLISCCLVKIPQQKIQITYLFRPKQTQLVSHKRTKIDGFHEGYDCAYFDTIVSL